MSDKSYHKSADRVIQEALELIDQYYMNEEAPAGDLIFEVYQKLNSYVFWLVKKEVNG